MKLKRKSLLTKFDQKFQNLVNDIEKGGKRQTKSNLSRSKQSLRTTERVTHSPILLNQAAHGYT